MADDYEHPHPNARIAWIIGGLIGVGFLVLIASIAEFSIMRKRDDWPWPPIVPLISLSAGALLAVFSVVMSCLRFARFGYRLREADLVVQSGVIWRTRRCVPRARIQHVDIDSGPLDRSLGIVDVSLYVAGGSGPVAQIPGLSPDAAEQLKEALLVERAADGV